MCVSIRFAVLQSWVGPLLVASLAMSAWGATTDNLITSCWPLFRSIPHVRHCFSFKSI
jgi:hypothetical protein